MTVAGLCVAIWGRRRTGQGEKSDVVSVCDRSEPLDDRFARPLQDEPERLGTAGGRKWQRLMSPGYANSPINMDYPQHRRRQRLNAEIAVLRRLHHQRDASGGILQRQRDAGTIACVASTTLRSMELENCAP